MHERRQKKVTDDEARAISEELLAGVPQLNTRQNLNLVMSKLFCLISQNRISRPDGALLAYLASLLLQTIPPPPQQNTQPKVIWDGFLGNGVSDPPDRGIAQQLTDQDPSDGYRG